MNGFLAGIVSLIIFGGLLAGFLWLFAMISKKYFGIHLTSRTLYSEANFANTIRHKENIKKLSQTDEETLKQAQENIKRKHFANTSDNLIEEIIIIEKNKTDKNDFQNNEMRKPVLDISKSETIGSLVYKNFNYCCCCNGNTIYLKFLNSNKGIIVISRGEPVTKEIDNWFTVTNPYVSNFEFKFLNPKLIRFIVTQSGRKFGYDITSKTPSTLIAHKWITNARTKTLLEFKPCK